MDGKVTAGDRELHKALLCLPEKNLARHRKDEPVVDGLELIARHRQAAVAAERERCVEAVQEALAERIITYAIKSSQRDPFEVAVHNGHEQSRFAVEVCEIALRHTVAAIRGCDHD